ncbi:hypothetical protein SAMN05421820_11573 [Pedobacter steynii]|uniref:Uncharacterized protein n=1 Tax=Pedobacter steynii TaxID=430522 RepID=A0A1H0JUA5_9SPHI|nr:hypothetical protein [Pedobacter steynii]NQX43160.1 hypothetical protein [Pedobacter steynii]SDO47082.1 hypothetical protein SAMN05421820_11573 [Pedobacter steynii]
MRKLILEIRTSIDGFIAAPDGQTNWMLWNWAVHCTVSKRYAIVANAKDECIGFRIAASI